MATAPPPPPPMNVAVASGSSLVPSDGSTASNTLYINNLNHKVKQETLKKGLNDIFKQFGKILGIIASRKFHLRGQAWVIFDETKSAENAMRQMQGFPYYDRPMRIAFAKKKSDPIAKRDGTFKPREKKAAPPVPSPSDQAAKRQKTEVAMTEMDEDPPVPNETVPPPAAAPLPPREPSKPLTAIPRPLTPMPPNRILIAEDLPAECNEMMLQMLFQQVAGLKEVRVIANKCVAFIEFESEMQADVALRNLNNFKLSPTNLLFLNFAKK